MPPFTFDAAPERIYWELTRACDLACRHCRACALARRDQRELETGEIFRTLEEIAAEAKPHVIFTGGDPLKRSDFFDIVKHAVALGLPCSVSPSVTPLLTETVIARLAALRVGAMSLSLDGSTASRHDALRGVVGTFTRTLTLAQTIADTPIALQINTLVTRGTVADLPAIHRVVQETGAERWSLFFLIATGRGTALEPISPARAETTLNWALDRAGSKKPVVTTTEAPHYRRIALTRRKAGRTHAPGGPIRGAGIRDGNGVMFISHIGEVQPSGFLPLAAGNARAEHVLRVYRESPLFQELRQPDRFRGRCGRCEFRHVCGGSRARAYAASGDPLESDPLCAHVPAASSQTPALA
ncbi:MAG TPA: TIGR04053 family radical SAM/SPASM domain-containing protein [Vicinamibacterales bacterium]|nr:TIGR04053 family radical SAM/SPASM domain-containing protein [Vicinamibacterales bacterium]